MACSSVLLRAVSASTAVHARRSSQKRVSATASLQGGDTSVGRGDACTQANMASALCPRLTVIFPTALVPLGNVRWRVHCGASPQPEPGLSAGSGCCLPETEPCLRKGGGGGGGGLNAPISGLRVPDSRTWRSTCLRSPRYSPRQKTALGIGAAFGVLPVRTCAVMPLERTCWGGRARRGFGPVPPHPPIRMGGLYRGRMRPTIGHASIQAPDKVPSGAAPPAVQPRQGRGRLSCMHKHFSFSSAAPVAQMVIATTRAHINSHTLVYSLQLNPLLNRMPPPCPPPPLHRISIGRIRPFPLAPSLACFHKMNHRWARIPNTHDLAQLWQKQ